MNVTRISSRWPRHPRRARRRPSTLYPIQQRRIKRSTRRSNSSSTTKTTTWTRNKFVSRARTPDPMPTVSERPVFARRPIVLLCSALSSGGGDRRSRKNSLSNYSVSNYSVLLNEFCCAPSDPIDCTLNEEKPKKKSGFANTVATFFSSKKREDEQPSTLTPTRKLHRSRSVSEASLERTTIR